ncbi:MAG: hypothetical protein IJY27_08025 [Clostridia bacterium]|nr:hypothetical protein [Clostridia bacterium]
MAYRPGAVKIVGKVIKAILYLIIATMVSFLVWRVYFSTSIPNNIKRIVVTDSLAEAYTATGGELGAFDQEQYTITRGDDNYGYFSIEDYVIIPEAKQVQIIFRYNNSTVEALAEDYDLTEMPDLSAELYDVTLVKTTDLTPENADDNNDEGAFSETRYYPSEVIAERTLLYNFRRIVFENVEINEDDLGLFADIYYVEDIDYGEDPYGALCLYDKEMANKPYEFTKKDINRIKKGVK